MKVYLAMDLRKVLLERVEAEKYRVDDNEHLVAAWDHLLRQMPAGCPSQWFADRLQMLGARIDAGDFGKTCSLPFPDGERYHESHVWTYIAQRLWCMKSLVTTGKPSFEDHCPPYIPPKRTFCRANSGEAWSAENRAQKLLMLKDYFRPPARGPARVQTLDDLGLVRRGAIVTKGHARCQGYQTVWQRLPEEQTFAPWLRPIPLPVLRGGWKSAPPDAKPWWVTEKPRFPFNTIEDAPSSEIENRAASLLALEDGQVDDDTDKAEDEETASDSEAEDEEPALAELPECAICHDQLTGTDTTSTKCGHAFHAMCLVNWTVDGKTSCPMCRACLKTGEARAAVTTAPAQSLSDAAPAADVPSVSNQLSDPSVACEEPSSPGLIAAEIEEPASTLSMIPPLSVTPPKSMVPTSTLSMVPSPMEEETPVSMVPAPVSKPVIPPGGWQPAKLKKLIDGCYPTGCPVTQKDVDAYRRLRANKGGNMGSAAKAKRDSEIDKLQLKFAEGWDETLRMNGTSNTGASSSGARSSRATIG